MSMIEYPFDPTAIDTMVISGERCQARSDKTIEVFDSATGLAITRVPRGDRADVDRAMESAREAGRGPWRTLSLIERAAALHRIAGLIRERGTFLAQVECVDVGKPLSQALRDVRRAADYFDFYAGVADKLHGESVPLGADQFCFTVLEPVGVTGHIVPWNYPLSTVARGLGPALACGNTAVVKPAEQTSLSTIVLAGLVLDAGLPAGVVNVVTGLGDEAGAALASHPDLGHLTFTGSVPTGRAAMQSAAASVAGLTLELGGKSPVVVMADADLDEAARGLVRGIFFNAGQICTAGSRLVVERPVHGLLVKALVAQADALTLDHGLRDPEMGPLVSAKQLDRVAGFVERAGAAGIELATGGRAATLNEFSAGAFFEPTILDNVPTDAEIAQEEIFGPVLTVHPVADLDEAIAVSNATRFGLAAGIYTHDVSSALRFARDVEAGQVFINGYLKGGDTVPFGGMKQSGFGREKGLAALHNYCAVKVVTASI